MMREATTQCLSKAYFLSNALEVVRRLMEIVIGLIVPILHDIKGLTKYSEFIAFSHVPRLLMGLPMILLRRISLIVVMLF